MNRRAFFATLAAGWAFLKRRISAPPIPPETVIYRPGFLTFTRDGFEAHLDKLAYCDCFHIKGVYDVNPRTLEKAVYAAPDGRRYVFAKAFIKVADGYWPPMITSGPYRNVDVEAAVELPAKNS